MRGYWMDRGRQEEMRQFEVVLKIVKRDVMREHWMDRSVNKEMRYRQMENSRKRFYERLLDGQKCKERDEIVRYTVQMINSYKKYLERDTDQITERKR